MARARASKSKSHMPLKDIGGRACPYIAWGWQGTDHYDHVKFRVIRVGAGKDGWTIESWSGDTNAMGDPVWRLAHEMDRGGADTLDAFRSFLWMLRERKIEEYAANTKAES